MHRSEADLLASYLKPTHTYLEWGSGGSSTAFAPLVATAHSIEHDCEWQEVVARRAADAGIGNLRLTCVPPSLTAATHPLGSSAAAASAVAAAPASHPWGTVSPFEHGSYAQFHSYVNAVDDLGVAHYDAVLIDGRARVATALRLLPYLSPSSIVFIHDWGTRSHLYAPVLRYYTPVARVAAVASVDPAAGPVDEPQGLLALRRSAAVTDAALPLPEAALHAAYHQGEVDYRDGAPPPAVTPSEVGWAWVVAKSCPAHWPLARGAAELVALVWGDVLRLVGIVVIVLAARAATGAPRGGGGGGGGAAKNGPDAAAAAAAGEGTPRRGRRGFPAAPGGARSTQWVVGERSAERAAGRSPPPRRLARAVDDASLPPDDGGAVARATARRKERGGSLSSIDMGLRRE